MAVSTLLLTAVLFLIGATLQRRISAQAKMPRFFLGLAAVILAIPGCLLALFYTHLFDSAVWFYQFRAVPYTELTASGLGLGTGIFYSWFRPTSIGEKLAIPAILAALVCVPYLKPVLDPIDISQLKSTCANGICLQSTPSTCGPASVATILRRYGSDVTEKELAIEAFTSRGGTENWYLARAIRRHGFDVIFLIQPGDYVVPPIPSIAGVLLPGGAGHYIAVTAETPTDVTIADPMRGELVIRKDALKSRYHFTGFFLIIHPGSQKPSLC